MTLIVRHIVAYAWPQFEITIPNQITLLLQIFFYHIQGNVTVSVTNASISACRPWSRRICLGERLYLTLIFRHIVAYAWPQFEVSLTHEIGLIVLIFFYHIQGNIIVSVTYRTILASRPRIRRIWLGVSLYMTLIVWHIVAYAWPQFEITLVNQIRLILQIFFYRIQGNVFVSVIYTPMSVC